MIEKINNDDLKILPGSGPFYFEGNNIGVLMIHGGGGGTCADLKPLAEELHKTLGYTVYEPLLPGYGTTPEVLKNITINEWKRTIEYEIDHLNRKCKKIVVGGHSMVASLPLFLRVNIRLMVFSPFQRPLALKDLLLSLSHFSKSS